MVTFLKKVFLLYVLFYYFLIWFLCFFIFNEKNFLLKWGAVFPVRVLTLLFFFLCFPFLFFMLMWFNRIFFIFYLLLADRRKILRYIIKKLPRAYRQYDTSPFKFKINPETGIYITRRSKKKRRNSHLTSVPYRLPTPEERLKEQMVPINRSRPNKYHLFFRLLKLDIWCFAELIWYVVIFYDGYIVLWYSYLFWYILFFFLFMFFSIINVLNFFLFKNSNTFLSVFFKVFYFFFVFFRKKINFGFSFIVFLAKNDLYILKYHPWIENFFAWRWFWDFFDVLFLIFISSSLVTFLYYKLRWALMVWLIGLSVSGFVYAAFFMY